jgi:hypothetical protein
LSVWSKSIVELSISVHWLSVRSQSIVELSIVELAVGVSAIVAVGVHGRKDASHFIVVGNSTQWVLAKTPRSHVAVGVSGDSTPRELHASTGRIDSISGTSVVSDSVASERELALAGELGIINTTSARGSGVSKIISNARRNKRGVSVVGGIARSVVGIAAGRIGRSVERSVRIVVSRSAASRVRSVIRIVGAWSVIRSIGWVVVWSTGRIAWSVIRSIVWSVVSRVVRVSRGISVGVSRVVWRWRRGSGWWRESRNTTSIEG